MKQRGFRMKNVFRIIMFVNLFALGFYGLSVIFSVFNPEQPFKVWEALSLPVFFFAYYLFRKRYIQLVLAEQEENRKKLIQQQKKKRKRK